MKRKENELENVQKVENARRTVREISCRELQSKCSCTLLLEILVFKQSSIKRSV